MVMPRDGTIRSCINTGAAVLRTSGPPLAQRCRRSLQYIESANARSMQAIDRVLFFHLASVLHHGPGRAWGGTTGQYWRQCSVFKTCPARARAIQAFTGKLPVSSFDRTHLRSFPLWSPMCGQRGKRQSAERGRSLINPEAGKNRIG
jgi:hypothetical protein